MKAKKKLSKDKVIDTLYEQIKKKDEQIKRLKEENILLLKTALRASEKKLKEKEKEKRDYLLTL